MEKIDKGIALEYAKKKLKEKIESIDVFGVIYRPPEVSYHYKVEYFDISMLTEKDIKNILKIQDEKLQLKKNELEKLYLMCDAIFFDLKKYKLIKEALVDASPCYAITELEDIVKKYTTGKSQFNVKYKVRKNNFTNIKCV